MKEENEVLPFPVDITDEMAVALTEILYALAGACETRYMMPIRRHHTARQAPRDPQRPSPSPTAEE